MKNEYFWVFLQPPARSCLVYIGAEGAFRQILDLTGSLRWIRDSNSLRRKEEGTLCRIRGLLL